MIAHFNDILYREDVKYFTLILSNSWNVSI
jgi:hypothetical protein